MNPIVDTEHREPQQQPARGDPSLCRTSSTSPGSPGGRSRTRRGGRGGRGGRGKNRHNRSGGNNNNNNDSKHSSPRSVAAATSSSPSVSPRGGGGGTASVSPAHLAKYSRPSSAAASPPHDAPMSKADIYFAMDCEMVGIGHGGAENALARVVLVNYDEEVVYDQYVAVSEPITDYRTFVSGITASDLDAATNPSVVSFDRCRAAVRSMLHGKILIGHGLASDLAALDMIHPWEDIRDTASYGPLMRKVTSRDVPGQDVLLPAKLRDLARDRCRMEIQRLGESHDPAEDAVAALRLYKAVRGAWEDQKIRQVRSAREMEEAAVRRAARRQQRVLARHRHQHQQQHMLLRQQQHILQAVPAIPRPNNMYNNSNNCKPSVHTVHRHQHQQHRNDGRSASPQMMTVDAPPLSPTRMRQHDMHPQHPVLGLGLLGMPELNHRGHADGHSHGNYWHNATAGGYDHGRTV